MIWPSILRNLLHLSTPVWPLSFIPVSLLRSWKHLKLVRISCKTKYISPPPFLKTIPASVAHSRFVCGHFLSHYAETQDWSPKVDTKKVKTAALFDEVRSYEVDAKVSGAKAFLTRALGNNKWHWPTSASWRPPRRSALVGSLGGAHLVTLARQLRKSKRLLANITSN